MACRTMHNARKRTKKDNCLCPSALPLPLVPGMIWPPFCPGGALCTECGCEATMITPRLRDRASLIPCWSTRCGTLPATGLMPRLAPGRLPQARWRTAAAMVSITGWGSPHCSIHALHARPSVPRDQRRIDRRKLLPIMLDHTDREQTNCLECFLLLLRTVFIYFLYSRAFDGCNPSNGGLTRP